MGHLRLFCKKKILQERRSHRRKHMENEVFAVEMRGISKSFGKVRANDHVDLKLKREKFWRC